MAVYSSSINFVSGKAKVEVTITLSCTFSNDGNRANCEGTNKRTYDCNYDTTTEKWSCVKTSTKTSPNTPNETTDPETLNKLTGSQIPLGLKSALDSAIKNQNSGLVMGQNNTQVTNSSESTINNSPNPPQCPTTGPIPPDCTMKPPLK